MSDSWIDVSLGELVDIKHGFAFGGEYFCDDPRPDALITPGNFAIGGGFQQNKIKYYSGPVPTDFILASGDLVVTMTDLSKTSDTLGYAGIVPNGLPYRLLHNQRVGLVRPKDPNRTIAPYLHWVMRTNSYRHEVLASASGSTVRHTSPSRIGAYRFKLPPLPEQRRIAAILGALDDKIELNRKMNRTLEEMAQALFKSWFIDFDGHEDLVESELGPIPRGWEAKPIGEVVRVVGGSTPSTTVPEYWDGVHAWATPKDLSGLDIPVLLDTERHITDSGLQKISSGLLPPGTFLLSSRAPIGYTAIAQLPVAINQGFIAIPPGGALSSSFLLFWARFSLDSIKGRAGGTTFAEISKAAFRPILVTVPPAKRLEDYEVVVGPLLDRIVANARESRTLIELRDTLLPKLISGELRVHEEKEHV